MSNRAKLQKLPSFPGTLTGVVLFALAAACGSPPQPSPPRPEPRTDPGRNWPDLSGTHTLTLSASSRCPLDLPDAMRTRTYTATVAQVGGLLTVKLPTIFPPWDNRTFGVDNRFTGTIGESGLVSFQFQFEEWFLEGLVTEFSAYGSMMATISPGGFSGFWDGYIRGLVTNGRVTCTAPDHGVVFSR